MKQKFSQRIGKTSVRDVFQIESIDEQLLNRLWNIILQDFFGNLSSSRPTEAMSYQQNVCANIWQEFFELRIDEIPSYDSGDVYVKGFLQHLKEWYFDAYWYEIYDFVEHIIEYAIPIRGVYIIEKFNEALIKESAGYRIINTEIAQITSEEEVMTIETAINESKWKSVKTHLTLALAYLSDRNTPDYRNSVKESISAIEALCNIINEEKNSTLGQALKKVEKKYPLHKALKKAFDSLYGYTSDAGGIRHSLLEDDTDVSLEDAKFMLVSCSAFTNYLRTKMEL
ncbi:MAG: hypothetical protein ACI9DK_002302 [Vicingaceae bacterium]|jgi:hypothetical protein